MKFDCMEGQRYIEPRDRDMLKMVMYDHRYVGIYLKILTTLCGIVYLSIKIVSDDRKIKKQMCVRFQNN